ncbi:MAG: DNA replication/repair protein RecF, partial [Bacillota bacterium]
LQLVKEGPAFRRRYMDTLLCQIRPSYFHDLQVYNRALIQRNRMLQTRNTEAIDGFDVQLCDAGTRIAAARAQLIGLLEPLCAREHAGLSGGEELKMEYRTGMDEMPVDAQGYFSVLEKSLPSDLQRGFTTKGVHRDDLALMIDQKDARRFASQGQQRSAALALRLAQCLAMEHIAKKRPVLLLDDVLSELDPYRVKQLLSVLKHRQALLTCTAPIKAENMEQPFASFRVHNGSVTRA